jgi:hypothetical protein
VGIILVIHHILQFFKNTLTVPKVKDLITQTKTQYKEIDDVLSSPLTTEAEDPNANANINANAKEEEGENEENEYNIYDI